MQHEIGFSSSTSVHQTIETDLTYEDLLNGLKNGSLFTSIQDTNVYRIENGILIRVGSIICNDFIEPENTDFYNPDEPII
jgi:hypothetical protein